MNSLLKTETLKKSYNGIKVISGQNLEINAGETLAIMGKSGSGKTTLLKMLGGIVKPDSGTVIFDGEDIFSKSEKERCRLRREKIGFVFQNYELMPEFNIRENIVFPLLLDGKTADKEYLNGLLEDLELADKIRRYPDELSGGEQQRAAIARALIAKPQLLLCDELTGNLDESTSRQVMDMLKRIHEKYKTAIIIVTHDRDTAAFAKRAITYQNGVFK